MNKTTKYDKSKSLVNSVEELDQLVVTKQDRIHSKEMKTSKSIYNLTVEIARLAQEDQRQIIALCVPGKLKPSKQ